MIAVIITISCRPPTISIYITKHCTRWQANYLGSYPRKRKRHPCKCRSLMYIEVTALFSFVLRIPKQPEMNIHPCILSARFLCSTWHLPDQQIESLSLGATFLSRHR